MPAKTMLFDQRVRTIYDFGASPHNFISFNPQGRLIALAGFGNLAGKMDIFDRRTFAKACTIDAPNTSYCDWSPDGRFLMTATLSPRLRVDNGIKIYHCSGALMHVQLIDELYQASWRPTPVDKVAPFAQALPSAPQPSASVQEFAAVAKPVPTRPAGAYRPPGARGLATPAIFKREDEGGAARVPTNGTATPPRMYNRSPAPGAGPREGGYQYANGGGNGGGGGYGGPGGQQNGGRRHVPGAPHTPSPGPDGGEKKNRKRKGKKEGGEEGQQGQGGNQNQGGNGGNQKRKDKGERAANGERSEDAASGRPSIEVTPDVDGEAGAAPNGKLHLANGNGTLYIPPPDLNVDGESPITSALDSALDPVAKKARNLNKKVRLPFPLFLRPVFLRMCAAQGHRRAQREGQARRAAGSDAAQEDGGRGGDTERARESGCIVPPFSVV